MIIIHEELIKESQNHAKSVLNKQMIISNLYVLIYYLAILTLQNIKTKTRVLLIARKRVFMGCITTKDVTNPKKSKPYQDNAKHVETALYKSKLDKSTVSKLHTPKEQQLLSPVEKNHQAPKILPILSTQFLSEYHITQTLLQSTRLQGPKLLTNKIHGGVSVLRVYQPQRINQQRLKKYHELMKFQLYTDEQQNYLLVDQYCAGPTISELFQGHQQKAEITEEDLQQRKNKIHNALLQVYDIIMKFHTNKTYLGNLNVFSFKKVSIFDDTIRLVDFNFVSAQQVECNFEMGHAHHNSFQADWQFFGYLLQFYFSPQSPIFISHKMQYVQSTNEKQQQVICNLLKGRQASCAQIQSLNTQCILIHNNNVLNGYRFCQDILRLIKSRTRRVKHKACYYSAEIKDYYKKRNILQEDDNGEGEMWGVDDGYDDGIKQLALGEQNLRKLETERMFTAVQKYIEYLNPACEEHFINYSSYAENFRKLKQLFIITNKNQKLQQLKDLIPQLK